VGFGGGGGRVVVRSWEVWVRPYLPQRETGRESTTKNAKGGQEPRTASRSHARTKAQSRSAVVGEIPSTAAAWSLVKPAKNRSSTSCALRASRTVNRVSASSRARSSSSGVGAATSSSSTRWTLPPCFWVFLRRA